VIIIYSSDKVILQVTDDGVGFDLLQNPANMLQMDIMGCSDCMKGQSLLERH